MVMRKQYVKPVLVELSECYEDGCTADANYRYVAQSRSSGKLVSYCFGHASVAKRFRGRIERMWTP